MKRITILGIALIFLFSCKENDVIPNKTDDDLFTEDSAVKDDVSIFVGQEEGENVQYVKLEEPLVTEGGLLSLDLDRDGENDIQFVVSKFKQSGYDDTDVSFGINSLGDNEIEDRYVTDFKVNDTINKSTVNWQKRSYLNERSWIFSSELNGKSFYTRSNWLENTSSYFFDTINREGYVVVRLIGENEINYCWVKIKITGDPVALWSGERTDVAELKVFSWAHTK